MAEITLANGEAIPNKPKKKSKAWLVILIIVLVVVVLPLAAVGVMWILLSNDNFTPRKNYGEITTEEVVKNMLVDSFDYAKTDQALRVRLTQENLNQLLYSSVDDIIKNSGGYIHNFTIQITDNNYNFKLDLNVNNIFKTVAMVQTKLTIDEAEDGYITFGITNIRIGKLDGFQKSINQALDMAKKYANFDEKMINEAIEKSGLHMTVDLAHLKIIYPKEDFRKDIIGKITETGLGGDTYSSMFEEILNRNDLITFKPNSESALEVAINLEALSLSEGAFGIDGYVIPQGYLTDISEAAKEKTINYLKNNVITEDKASALFHYYEVGFDHLDDAEKTVVQPLLDASTIAIADETYDFTVPNEDSLATIAKTQIDEQVNSVVINPLDIEHTVPEHIDVNITTTEIDKMLSSSNIIGSSTVLTRKADDTYKCNYVVISRVTTAIKDSKLYFIITVNINGYEVQISLETEKVSASVFGEVSFKINDMYLGNQKVSDSTKAALMKLITDSVDHGAFNDTAKIETVDGSLYFRISLKSIYEQYKVLDIYSYINDTYFDTDFILTSNEANTEPGNICFKATRNIHV